MLFLSRGLIRLYSGAATTTTRPATTTTTTTTTTDEAPTVTEASVVLVTGGAGRGSYSSVEIYPTGCSLPPLPSTRTHHATFTTADISPKIVTCGGHDRDYTASCLVLDVENQQWDATQMGELTMPRANHASVTIENVGTYLIGGYQGSAQRTTDFLAAGSTEWVAGPAIPVDMNMPCAVRISPLSFLIIHGNDIREYQVDVTNPTSSDGWQSASKFPQLQTSRYKQPGCSKIGDQVVIAGGFDNVRSTEALDLSTRSIVYAGDLISQRQQFHMATITMNGQQTLFALGGWSDSQGVTLNSVEQFNTNNNTWTLAATSMAEARYFFGAVVVAEEIVCPA